jgi:hypothetical protein
MKGGMGWSGRLWSTWNAGVMPSFVVPGRKTMMAPSKWVLPVTVLAMPL